MIEQLAEKKMALEDQVDQLKKAVSELEALQEVHEQLVESNRELEMDLREVLEMAHAATRESIREREAALETIMDRDATIIKFRELVQRMTEQHNELRSQMDSRVQNTNHPQRVKLRRVHAASWAR